MANTERKARKRAGIKFTKPAKVGTPLLERVIPTVHDRNGRSVGPLITHLSKRVLKARAKQLQVVLGVQIADAEKLAAQAEEDLKTKPATKAKK